MIRRMILSSLLMIALCEQAFTLDPIRIHLLEGATTTTAIVTLGQVAEVTGGDAKRRAMVAALDVGDRPKNGSSLSITRRQVEFRLKLAGFSTTDCVVGGVDRVTVCPVRVPIASERIVSAAREELLRRLGPSVQHILVELVQPIAVTLPEVAPDDEVVIVATPHVSKVSMGRTQMNVSIKVNGEKRLSLPVFLQSSEKSVSKATAPHPPLSKLIPVKAGPLIKAQQRVTMKVLVGELVVSAQGDALQDGQLGQRIRVMNIDSKKTIVGTVSGPGTIDVDLAGGQP